MMNYKEFNEIIGTARLNRYLIACNQDTRKAMTLYRKNLKLTQELFTLVSCFEVALRNKIDGACISVLGNNWLRDAVNNGGIFDNGQCFQTKETIDKAIKQLKIYSHSKLVAELGFGFWRFMFAPHQYYATHQILLQGVFPSKPKSTKVIQYNNKFIFNQLAKINDIRNRMAHHEPICFTPQQPIKNTTYAREHYNSILELFRWMDIDERDFLYGLDHIENICAEIDKL